MRYATKQTVLKQQHKFISAFQTEASTWVEQRAERAEFFIDANKINYALILFRAQSTEVELVIVIFFAPLSHRPSIESAYWFQSNDSHPHRNETIYGKRFTRLFMCLCFLIPLVSINY